MPRDKQTEERKAADRSGRCSTKAAIRIPPDTELIGRCMFQAGHKEECVVTARGPRGRSYKKRLQ